MKIQDLDDWAAFLDREISTLRGHHDPAAPTFAMLDTSYAELRAASDELKEQTARAETVLLDAERMRRRVDAVFQLSADAIFETDADGRILEANASAARLLNVRLEYLLGKALVLFVKEEERPLLSKFLHPSDPAEVIRQDLSIQPRDGPPVPATVSVKRVEPMSGDPVRLMWLIRGAAE